MTPDRWQRIEKIFNDVLEIEPAERDRYLTEACSDDSGLRREIEGLLAADKEPVSFLSSVITRAETGNSGLAVSLRTQAEELSHYRILSRIGAGGMGEVWLAEDLRLGRRVALKLLPRQFLQDPDLLSRFRREARAASSLNHPNIITIYEIGQMGQTHFIATEFIEGVTLRQRLVQGSLATADLLNIAIQLASALGTAHSAGIIHRDIKPENIMIRPDGLVKVLDFGLARMTPLAGKPLAFKVDGEVEGGDRHLSTARGTLIGTPRYMAPEQVRGIKVDSRADIFSLGVVIYEMIAGRAPFIGETIADQIAAILERDAEKLSNIRPGLPPNLELIVARAIAKNPDDRFQTMEALLEELRLLQSGRFSEGGTWNRNLSQPTGTETTRIDSLSLFATVRQHAAIKNYYRGFALLAALLLILGGYLSGGYYRGWWPFAASISPPLAEALPWYEIGTQAIRDGSYDQAREFFEQAVRKDPRFALARARLAEALSEQDYNDEAQQQLFQVYALVPDRTRLPELDRLSLEAILNSVGRNYAGAAECYSRMLAIAPAEQQSSLRLDLGLAFEKNFETAKAIENYQLALRSNPRSAAARLRLAIIYGEREKDLAKSDAAFDEAEKLYREAGNKEGLAAVFFNRGMIYDALSRLEEGRKQLQSAVETGSRYLATRATIHLSGNSLAAGKIDQAIREADQGLEQASKNNMRSVYTLGLIAKAGIYHDTGNYPEAEKYYAQAIESARAYNGRYYGFLARLNLGSLQVQIGRLDQGLENVEPAYGFFEESKYRNEALRALLVLARARRLKLDYAGARKSYDALLPLAEKSGDPQVVAIVHSELSQLFIFQERFTEALPHIDESYRIYQQQGINIRLPYALLRRARALWQLGDYAGAQGALNDPAFAGAQRDVEAEATVLKSEILLSLGQYRDAIVKLRKRIANPGIEAPELFISALRISCEALTLSGSPEQARAFCRRSVDEARRLQKPRQLADSLLASSEVESSLGNWKEAQTTAAEAATILAGQDRPETEWRALTELSRSMQANGEQRASADTASRANEKLLLLKSYWGEVHYNKYLARPDINRMISRLNKLSNRNQR
jgi:serine/threonine protein kinase/predicted negative regulator of RcsB-dependent stress response